MNRKIWRIIIDIFSFATLFAITQYVEHIVQVKYRFSKKKYFFIIKKINEKKISKNCISKIFLNWMLNSYSAILLFLAMSEWKVEFCAVLLIPKKNVRPSMYLSKYLSIHLSVCLSSLAFEISRKQILEKSRSAAQRNLPLSPVTLLRNTV